MALGQQEKLVERFFRPRGIAPSIQEDGFLPDMDGTYAKYSCPNTVRLADIVKSRCVVLLGEPGIGKSVVMEQRRRDLSTDAVVYDLRFVPAEAVLSCTGIVEWQRNQRDLHLVIDSIDEATNPDFARLLVGELKKGDISRLRLELACRSAEWPPVLEHQLPRLFGEEHVRYFTIEPLRRKDVVAIAEARGVDAGPFLESVWRNGICALASVPMTLLMLLDIFGRERALPGSQSDIYEKACLELCRENSQTRRIAASDMDMQTKLAHASEIAAASILCRRNLIVESTTVVQEAELTLIELAEAVSELTEGVVRETLKSGLFVTRGSGTWGWFHQSIPEFLAARWLSRCELSEVQLRQLLIDQVDEDGLVPQLKGLAAWSTCFDSRVIRLLADVAPELLLSVSSGLVTDKDRAAAASRHLERLAALKTTEWLDRTECHRLKYPGLAGQIGAHLKERAANMLVKRRVLHIAGVLGLSELEETVCAIALDPTEDAATRIEAIDAAFKLPGDRGSIVSRLRHLAEPNCEGDPDEEIRGALLSHLWPEWLDAPTMFGLLTRPRKPWSSGRYGHFWYVLEESMRAEDLVDALAWAERNARPGCPEDYFAVERLSAAICRLALEHVDKPDVRDGLAKVALRVLKHAASLFGTERNATQPVDAARHREQLRLLVSSMADLSDDPDQDGFRVVFTHSEQPMMDQLEIEWLLQRWRTATGNAKAFLGKTIATLDWRYEDPRVRELVLAEIGDVRESPLLRFPRWIDLGSDQAICAKREYVGEANRKWKWAEDDRRRKEELERRRRALFAAALAGDPVDWAAFVLDRCDDCQWDKHGVIEGIFTLSTLTEDQKGQFVQSAKRYLLTDPTGAETGAQNAVAYISLRLLQATEPNGRDNPLLIGKWTSAIVRWDTAYLYHQFDTESHRELLKVVFQISKVEATAALRIVLRWQLEGEWPPAIFEYLPKCDSVNDVLIGFLSCHQYYGRTRNLLAGLLQVQRERALDWARSELGASAVAAVTSRRRHRRSRCCGWRDRGRRCGRWGTRAAIANHQLRRAEIAAVLAAEGRSDSWRIAWDEFSRDPRIAKDALLNAVGRFERDTWGQDLTEQQVAACYDWLESNVPIDRKASEFSEDWMLRQRLLGRLVASGTPESVVLVRELGAKHPDNVALKVVLPQALSLVRERSWQPLKTGEFRKLTASRSARLVTSDDQLLDVVVEVLGAFQALMHCETPAVGRFWSCWTESRKNVYSPKGEGNISDELAIFLREELNKVVVSGTVVVNREAEIRSGDADRPGEEPDLLVQAMGKLDGRGPFQVAIEVKGSWNAGVETAIETQLRDRYLSHGNLRCGIYVVGWFECANWHPSDKARHTACRRHTREGLRASLESTAKELETDGRRVRVVVLDLTMGKLSPATCAKDSA